MVKINSKIINQKKNQTFVNLKQLNTTDYELTQVQKYSQDALSNVSDSINNLHSQVLILSKTKNQVFDLSTNKAQYIQFDETIFGDISFLDKDAVTILTPTDGVIYLGLNVSLSLNASNIAQIYLQIDKSKIEPQIAVPTNVEYCILSTQADTQNLSISVNYSLVVNKGQKLRLVFYSPSATATLFFEKPFKTQFIMRW